MDHGKIREISDEIYALLEQQSNTLNACPINSMPRTDVDAYHERNQRIRDLSRELAELR